ncbi:hypothetical protein TNCV_4993091 [Trichonephila clavipes]|nr:hypothetical protein TNCV_4993091 [Trichonephila clavipes]
MIRIISTVKCYFQLHTLKNWKVPTICEQATCDDSGPSIGLGLPPYNIITHTVKIAEEGKFANVLVIQSNDHVVTAMDKAIGIHCSYDIGNKTEEIDLNIT